MQRRYNDGVRLHPLESIEEGAGTESHDDDAESISGSLFFKSPGTAAIAVSDPAFLAAPEDTSTRKVTGPYAARPGLGRPPPYPAPAVPEASTLIVARSSSSHSPSEPNTTSVALSDSNAYPDLHTAKNSVHNKRTAKTNQSQQSKPIGHFNRDLLKQHRMTIKISHGQTCKFSGKPKYEVELQQPNDFDIQWAYSVPCGDCGKKENGSWIFLDMASMPTWGTERKNYIEKYLGDLNWTIVYNAENKRFICPTCSHATTLEL